MFQEKTRAAVLALVIALTPVIGGSVALAADSNPDPRVAEFTDGSGFTCSGPVDLDLVRVTNPRSDAIKLNAGCTGRIGRVEVDTYTNDGIKVAQGTGVHDLAIEGGYITCHGSKDGAHQDGVQAQGGVRVTLTGLDIDCGISNAQLFLNGSGVQDFTCVGCNLRGGAAHTALIQTSLRSGIVNTVVCPDRTPFGGFVDTSSKAKQLVNVGTTIVSDAQDPRC